MTKAKRIRSIQFLPDRVIVDYGENHLYQFCKSCTDGKHMKNFLNDFCGEPNITFIDERTAIRLERRFYHRLAYGPLRGIFASEAENFGAYVKRRCTRIIEPYYKKLAELLKEIKPGKLQ